MAPTNSWPGPQPRLSHEAASDHEKKKLIEKKTAIGDENPESDQGHATSTPLKQPLCSMLQLKQRQHITGLQNWLYPTPPAFESTLLTLQHLTQQIPPWTPKSN
jgi:hypothetical protein